VGSLYDVELLVHLSNTPFMGKTALYIVNNDKLIFTGQPQAAATGKTFQNYLSTGVLISP
jgi:hypothetical protein